LLWTIAWLLRIPRKVAICLIVPGLFFYAAITGLNTASVRAATMAAVVLGGAFLDRKVLAGNSLAAAAVLLLCVDTQQLFSMGFQLSFAIVSTIILLADPVFKLLFSWFQPDPFLPRSLFGPLRRIGLTSWRMVARGASVSLAAWLGSLLLILPYFYLITPVSLFANLAVGLMSLLATNIAPWLALVFNNANWLSPPRFFASLVSSRTRRPVTFISNRRIGRTVHAPRSPRSISAPARPSMCAVRMRIT